MMSKEEWKEIEGYEGYYEVSNKGRVRSLPREVTHKRFGICKISGKILKPIIEKKAKTVKVGLNKDGKYRSKRIKQLVAGAFIANPNGLTYVIAINGDHLNNNVSNLMRATQSEINELATRNTKKGGEAYNARKVVKLDKLNNELAVYGSIVDAAKSVGVNPTSIRKVCKGLNHTCKGYVWRYLD